MDILIEDTDIYIFEFKFEDSAENAISQIHKNRYYEKFISKASKKEIYLVGVEFRNRNVGEWLVEKLAIL